MFFQFFSISHVFVYRTLAADAQRPSGLAKAGGTILFMRSTNVQFPTAFSAALPPRLRQTASCVAVFYGLVYVGSKRETFLNFFLHFSCVRFHTCCDREID